MGSKTGKRPDVMLGRVEELSGTTVHEQGNTFWLVLVCCLSGKSPVTAIAAADC